MSLWSIGTHLASHFCGGETKWRHPLPSLPPPRPSRLHLIHAHHRHTDVRAHGSTTRPTRPRGAVSVGPHVFVSGPRVAHPGRRHRVHQHLLRGLPGHQWSSRAGFGRGQVVGFNGGGLCPEAKDGPRMEVGAYGLCSIQEGLLVISLYSPPPPPS